MGSAGESLLSGLSGCLLRYVFFWGTVVCCLSMCRLQRSEAVPVTSASLRAAVVCAAVASDALY
jgi:hypothetical protein